MAGLQTCIASIDRSGLLRQSEEDPEPERTASYDEWSLTVLLNDAVIERFRGHAAEVADRLKAHGFQPK
jgi:hypothetical protein